MAMNSIRRIGKVLPKGKLSTQRFLATVMDPSPDQEPSPMSSIPGPSGLSALPYIGMLFEMKPFTNYDIQNMQGLFQEWRKEYGSLMKFRVGSGWYVCVYDPNDIAKVFKAEGKYPSRGDNGLLDTYERRTGSKSGLLTLQGKEWQSLRSPVQKTMMRPKAIVKYAERVSLIADEFVSIFEEKKRIDNLPYKLMEYTSEGVGLLCFNTRLGCISASDHVTELMENVETFLEVLGSSFFHVPLFTVLPTPTYKRFEKAAKYLNKTASIHIDEAFAKMKSSQSTMDPSLNPDIGNNLLLDLISTPGMTRDIIRRTLVDVFLGGIDSTANAMTFLFYFLAKNQDKQQKLYDELCRVLPDNGPITEDVLSKLVYLKACVKESMRLVYPLPMGTGRLLNEDIVLQGYQIKKGTMITFGNGIICRDDQYFPQQDQYIPERWLRGDNRSDINPFAYLPFGFGPRKCVGQRFAEQEIYICTAKMFRKYRFVLPAGVTDIPYRYFIFATPLDPTSFLLEQRESNV